MNLLEALEDNLPVIGNDELRVLHLFSALGEGGTRSKISLDEAAKRTGVPVERMNDTLDSLSAKEYITKKKGRTFVLDRQDGYTFEVTFTKAGDEDSLQELINENNQLKRLLAESQGETCGLGDILPNEPAQVFRVAESIVHRALTNEEIFYLSNLIARYGSRRVTSTLHDAKKTKSPLRATWAMLNNGRKGKPIKNNAQPEEVIEYRILDNYDPWRG